MRSKGNKFGKDRNCLTLWRYHTLIIVIVFWGNNAPIIVQNHDYSTFGNNVSLSPPSLSSSPFLTPFISSLSLYLSLSISHSRSRIQIYLYIPLLAKRFAIL